MRRHFQRINKKEASGETSEVLEASEVFSGFKLPGSDAMPADTISTPPQKPFEVASVAPAPQPRLWPAIVLVALYWTSRYMVYRQDMLYFYRFLYGMASAALLALAFLIWWWASRRIRLVDKVYGFVIVCVGFFIAGKLCHPSFGWFGLMTGGLPIVLTAATAWMALMLVCQPTGLAWNRLGILVVIALAWGYFTLIRIDGVNTELQADIRWRWQPSEEELFLSHRPAADVDRAPSVDGWSPVLTAGDWPEFRGPDRQGLIRGDTFAPDWTSQPPRQVWRQRVGPAWSSVIVVGNRLFTQEQRGEQECVVCYDAASGHLIWIHEDHARFTESVSGAGPRGTPTYAAGRVYTLGATGLLNCLDGVTGHRLWSHDIEAEVNAKPPMWGLSGSPLVADGRAIVFAGGDSDRNLLAYRADTGELLWTAPAGADSYSSPQLVTLAGRPQILMLSDHGLSAVDPATGALLWKHGPVWKGAPRAIQAHVVGDKELIVGSLEGAKVARIEVTPDGDAWKVSQLWSSTGLQPEYNDFVLHQGFAYGFDTARFSCIDLATGQRRWKGPRFGRGQVMLLPDSGLLLVLTEQGEAIVMAANPEQPEERGRFQALSGKTWNHPVIAHGRLYVRNAEELACYELPK
jgi:outer membrane protein assembly factor BamB